MDFDEWIRAQLAATPKSPVVRSPWMRRPPAMGRMAPALQWFAAALAVSAIAVGLYSVGTSQPISVQVLVPEGQSLPADTWAGVPPAPAVQDSGRGEVESPTLPTARPKIGEGRPAPVATKPSNDDGQPSPPAQPGAAPAPSASSQPSSSTSAFGMRGGTVSATCRGANIVLNSATPSPGFQAGQEVKNEGRTLDIRFRSETFESEIEVWCSAGLVQSQIQEGAR
jgi:hypothetical protein